MSSRLKRTIGIAIPVLISAVLVVWVVCGIEDPSAVWEALKSASMLPLLAVAPVYLLSHLVRAVRWRRIIGEKVSLYYTLSSVLIGYLINGVIPRGGELARVVNMNYTTKVPIAKLATTLIAERILDIFVLLLLIGGSFWLEGDRIGQAFPALTAAVPTALGMAAVGFLGMIMLAFIAKPLAGLVRKIFGKANDSLSLKLETMVLQMGQGLAFIKKPIQVFWISVETAVIWSLYILVFGLGLHAFGLFEQVGVSGCAVTYAITGASSLVPSAGQIGVFHKFGQDALTLIYDADPAASLAFVIVLHLMLFYVIIGIAAIAVWFGQGFLKKKADDLKQAQK